MTYAYLNTICPVCGSPVPDIMPPLEALESRPPGECPVPMLRVCSSACALLVTLDTGFYYRGAQANIKASLL